MGGRSDQMPSEYEGPEYSGTGGCAVIDDLLNNGESTLSSFWSCSGPVLWLATKYYNYLQALVLRMKAVRNHEARD